MVICYLRYRLYILGGMWIVREDGGQDSCPNGLSHMEHILAPSSDPLSFNVFSSTLPLFLFSHSGLVLTPFMHI